MYAFNFENMHTPQPGGAILSYAMEFLDHAIPLLGASHNEVETYGVDIPTRYATLFAMLTDGRKVRLQDARKFAGWSGCTEKRSFLFRNDERHFEIQTDAADSGGRMAPGNICDLILEAADGSDRKFISPDGSQLVL